MLVIQIIILILSFAMAMDGANKFAGQSNFLFGFLRNILGFPLYIIVDFNSLVNSHNFRFELIPLFIGNTLIQFISVQIIYNQFKISSLSRKR
jgi:hypothetical protein